MHYAKVKGGLNGEPTAREVFVIFKKYCYDCVPSNIISSFEINKIKDKQCTYETCPLFRDKKEEGK